MGLSELWLQASASWCVSEGHQPRAESTRICVVTDEASGKFLGPMPGHELCRPIVGVLDERH